MNHHTHTSGRHQQQVAKKQDKDEDRAKQDNALEESSAGVISPC